MATRSCRVPQGVSPVQQAAPAQAQQDALTNALVAELRATIADLRADRDHWRGAFEGSQRLLAVHAQQLAPVAAMAPPSALCARCIYGVRRQPQRAWRANVAVSGHRLHSHPTFRLEASSPPFPVEPSLSVFLRGEFPSLGKVNGIGTAIAFNYPIPDFTHRRRSLHASRPSDDAPSFAGMTRRSELPAGLTHF